MSIYATGWAIKIHLPKWLSHKFDENRQELVKYFIDGPWEPREELLEWIEVYCQFVPAHIGQPFEGYESDPYSSFLTPIVENYGPNGLNLYRAAIILQEGRDKKEGQRYIDPLLVLSGEEYENITWKDLLSQITQKIRSNNEDSQNHH